MLLYNLRFAWWNAALSPAAPQAKSNASEDAYATVCDHITSLLQEHSCDFLALCEVSQNDVAHFTRHLQIHGISILDLTHTVGRTRFDIAVIYNNKKIKVHHKHSLNKTMTDQIIKAAQVVDVVNIDDNKVIHVYLCHWASRINSSGSAKRMESARMIYQSASEHMAKGEDVIVMGDFNDNPYDQSLIDNLHASRCHDTVRKYPKQFFYNPFWRSVVSEQRYSHLAKNTQYRSGSLKFKEFSGTMWHSYDQIIVSGSFLNNGEWHLNEYEAKVIASKSILGDYEDSKHFIDHLPIVCEITRI